jgi:hypothetical protein
MSGDFTYTATTPETDGVKDAAPPLAATPEQAATPPVETKTDDEPEVLEIPTGEKLVPLSALETAREKAKSLRSELETTKAEMAKGAEKDAKIAELTSQLQQVMPLAQAYQAAVQAQQQQPPKPAEPTAEQTAELKEIAQELDFYKGDGTLDLDRAKRHQDRLFKMASQIAQQQVAPFQQQTIADKSGFMLQRALITKTPDGAQPDPEVLQQVWARLDPRLTATPEGAAQAFSVALGHSTLLGKVKGGKATQEVIPDPLPTEKAGGKDVTPVSLSDSDRRMARDLGMTDKEYSAELAKMPTGWGKAG